MMRKILLAIVALVVLLIVAVAGAAMLIDVDQFRPTIESSFQSAVGRKVSLGKLKLALFAGNIEVENVSIADDPSFGAEPFVTTKAVKVAVDIWPLVVSRSLRVKSFTLDEPHILLRRSPAGTWNFASIGGQPGASASKPGASAPKSAGDTPNVAVAKLAITGGRVTVAAPGPKGKDRVYTDVNIEASDLSYTSQFPFRLDAKTPGDGVVHMEGKAGPLDPNDASATPLEAAVQIKQFNLATTGFIDPASGIGGVIDFDGTLTSNGREAVSKGTLSANKLQLVQGSAPAGVPVKIDYRSSYDLKQQSGTIAQGDVHIGRALARLSGSFKTEKDTTSVRMKLAGHQMPVPELEATLPAIGVTLPSGASLEGGTLDVDLDISGPVDRLTTTGPIAMSNAKLKGFDLGSKMAAVAAFAGVPHSADTAIQTLKSTLHVAPSGIRADALELVIPAIGSLSGSGTVATQGALDFKMLAQLSASASSAIPSGAMSRVTSIAQAAGGTPFLVTGTTSNPRFSPDLSAAVRNVVTKENATKAATGLLGGFLKKKGK